MFRNNLKCMNSSATQTFKASDIAKIYKFPPPPNTPLTISVISFGGGLFGNVSSSGILTNGDVQAYWTSLGITSQPTVIILPIDGALNSPIIGQNETAENTIDVSMIGACCATSNLTIILFIAPNSLNEFQNLITNATSPLTINNVRYTPSVVSISWGATEIYFTQEQIITINASLKNASANGINICASTGDEGSTDGVEGNLNYVSFPASSQYVTACGGTNLICPTLNYSDYTTVEKAWSSGGGGISQLFAKPTWQNAAIGAYRSIPDIALVADPTTGVEFILNGSNVIYGGTSIVSPAMAAYYACLNTNTFLLPSLYAASTSNKNSFHDITVGSNGSYFAGTGYDCSTGLGSIAGDILALQLVNPPLGINVTGITLNNSSANIAVGKQISFNAVVSPENATDKSITWISGNNSIATVLAIVCPRTEQVSSIQSSYQSAELIRESEAIPPTLGGGNVGFPYFASYTCAELKTTCHTAALCDQCAEIAHYSHSECSRILANNARIPHSACDSIGIVTGVSSGTTTISAITNDGQFTATARITVNSIIIPVSGVSLNIIHLILSVGSQKQLVAKITPTNATNTGVKWTSTSAIATVSDTGLVTANAIGSCSIIVKTVDGGFTARTLLTITKAQTVIRFNPQFILLYTRQTYQSNLVIPVSAQNITIVYTSSVPSIASVNSSGLITTYSQGIAIIRATVAGVSATLTVYVIDNVFNYIMKSNIQPIKSRGYSRFLK